MNSRIKFLREEQKKTQQEVANYLGLTQQSYGRYETANIIPSGDLLDKLAEYYNVTIDYIIGRSDIPETRKLEDDFQVMHRAYQGMDSSKKEKFKKMLAATFEVLYDEDKK